MLGYYCSLLPFYVRPSDFQFILSARESQRIVGYIATVASSLFHWMMLTASSPHSVASCSFSGIYSCYWSRPIWLRRKSSTWDFVVDYRIDLECLSLCMCVVGYKEKHTVCHSHLQSEWGNCEAIVRPSFVPCTVFSLTLLPSLLHVNLKIITNEKAQAAAALQPHQL